MTLKNKLESLNTTWTQLAQKIKNKLAQHQQALTQKTNQLNETNRKLETTLKENSENEQVLEQLLKEFKELAEELG